MQVLLEQVNTMDLHFAQHPQVALQSQSIFCKLTITDQTSLQLVVLAVAHLLLHCKAQMLHGQKPRLKR